MKSLTQFKATGVAMAMALAAVLVAPVQPAQALQWQPGDVILAIYGNNTEYVQNLGTFSTLTAQGASFTETLSPSVLTAVGGANTLKYTLVGFNGTIVGGATSIFAGTNVPASSWTSLNLRNINSVQYQNALIGWQGNLAAVGDARNLIPASDPLSFSSIFGTSDSLTGAFPKRMSSDVDTLLQLVGRQFFSTFNTTPLTTFGTALLQSNGTFTLNGPAAVPLPAAAVLFATGMIGLVGIARRSLGKIS